MWREVHRGAGSLGKFSAKVPARFVVWLHRDEKVTSGIEEEA